MLGCVHACKDAHKSRCGNLSNGSACFHALESALASRHVFWAQATMQMQQYDRVIVLARGLSFWCSVLLLVAIIYCTTITAILALHSCSNSSHTPHTPKKYPVADADTATYPAHVDPPEELILTTVSGFGGGESRK